MGSPVTGFPMSLRWTA